MSDDISTTVDIEEWQLAVLASDDLSSSGKQVLLTLSVHFQINEFCDCSVSSLADHAGLSRTTVQKKLRHFDRHGWIERGEWKPGQTYVTHPAPPPENTPDDPRSKMNSSLRRKVLKRDSYTCQQCGVSLRNSWHNPPKLEVDHIVPVSKGGRSHLDNLQTLCRECNLEKCDEVPDTCEGGT